MNHEEFEEVFELVTSMSRSVLIEKAKEYATDTDRLSNFKQSAVLIHGTPEQALWGFVTKHLIALSDMVKSGKDFTDAQWDEKIGDTINYMILLKALTVEKKPTRNVLDRESPGPIWVSQQDHVLNGNEWVHYCPERETSAPLRIMLAAGYNLCGFCKVNAPKIEIGGK